MLICVLFLENNNDGDDHYEANENVYSIPLFLCAFSLDFVSPFSHKDYFNKDPPKRKKRIKLQFLGWQKVGNYELGLKLQSWRFRACSHIIIIDQERKIKRNTTVKILLSPKPLLYLRIKIRESLSNQKEQYPFDNKSFLQFLGFGICERGDLGYERERARGCGSGCDEE